MRLIKGAYWDHEVIRSEEHGWPVPVWTAKHQTDACFERMAERFVAALCATLLVGFGLKFLYDAGWGTFY